MSNVDKDAAEQRLMRFLAVEGVTGKEAAIAKELTAALIEAGVPKKAIRLDDANTKIPVPTETGNLIVDLPGRGALASADRVLFMTHMDTVPLCAGAVPKRVGKRIVPAGKTALGGDNRTGCAVLVTLAAELVRHKLDHPPITMLFTVREESGLWGARFVDKADLGGVKHGFNYDGSDPSYVTIGAVGADHWQVEITGRASHAGVAPEKGISATMIMAEALADVRRKGWFGKVMKGNHAGTSNIGPVGGMNGGTAGDATNVVTDYVHCEGESRSQEASFHKEITAAFKASFVEAAERVTNADGKAGRVKFTSRTNYHPFRLKETLPVVKKAMAAVKDIGLDPELRSATGGLDANWLVRHGIPTVTLGAGQHSPHTIEEYIELGEFAQACQLAVRLATSA